MKRCDLVTPIHPVKAIMAAISIGVEVVEDVIIQMPTGIDEVDDSHVSDLGSIVEEADFNTVSIS